MRLQIRKFLPFILLVLFWIIFSYPSLFQGKVPLATDITVGMYYPWLDSGKVPIKNPILTDTVSQFWIWRQWAIDNLTKGHISLWNPYILSGSLQSPWFHTLIFSPLNTFYFILPMFQAISFIILSQILFSLLFSYIFFLKISHSKLAALLGSICFSFSSYFIGWLTWGSVSWTLALIPLSLYLVEKIFEFPKPFFILLFFVSQLFSLLGGHPQTYLYYLIIIFCFSICKYIQTKLKKTLIIIIFTFIFSCLCASFVLLPSAQIIKDSIRSQDLYIKSYNYGFVSLKDLITSAVTPSFYGNPATNNYWGGIPNFQEKLFWFGIIPFSLAVFWIINFIKNRQKSILEWFLIFILFLGFALSLKYPFGILIYWLKIPFLSTSPAGRGLILSVFSMITMAVLSFKDLISGNTKYFRKSIFITGLVILLLYLELLILPIFSITSSQINIAFRNLSLSALVFIVYYVIYFIATKKYSKLYLLIPFLCFLDLLYFAKKYTPFNPTSYYFPSNNLLDALRPDLSLEYYRVEREKSELVPPNMWQVYSLSSTQGYDPITSSKYVKFLINKDLIKSPTRYIEWQNKDLPKLQNLGIKYYLTLKRDKDDHVSQKGIIDPIIDQKVWKIATESGSVVVLQNKQYKAPYFLENNQKLVFLNKTDDTWDFQTYSTNDTNLIIIENNHPSWVATIDNQRVNISDYQDTFMQIRIPQGNHKIKIYFKNDNFLNGIYISSISFLCFLVSLFIINKKVSSKKANKVSK